MMSIYGCADPRATGRSKHWPGQKGAFAYNVSGDPNVPGHGPALSEKKNLKLRYRVLIVAGLLFVMGSLSELQAANKSEEPTWEYTLAFPMIWAPDIDGHVRGGGDQVDIKIPFRSILENLSFGLMGDFYAQKGPWSFVFKGNFLDAKTETVYEGLTSPDWGVPIVASHRIDTEIQMSANDVLARYSFEDSGLVLYTGVRHFYTRVDMDITPLSGGLSLTTHATVAKEHLFDWLVGLGCDRQLNDRWGISLSGDIGLAGDNDRDYGANIAVFFTLNKRDKVWLGYRYLQIGNDRASGDITQQIDFVQHGPTLGWAFTW